MLEDKLTIWELLGLTIFNSVKVLVFLLSLVAAYFFIKSSYFSTIIGFRIEDIVYFLIFIIIGFVVVRFIYKKWFVLIENY